MNPQPLVLPAVSRGIAKTLVDGTIRVTIDIEPGYGLLAMQMLGMPGSPVAIAGLNALPSPADQNGPQAPGGTPPDDPPAPEAERPTGGPLARSAGLLAREAQFQAFCRWIAETGVINADGLPDDDVEAAAEVTRRFCGVTTRAELDHDASARELFRELMRRYRRFIE